MVDAIGADKARKIPTPNAAILVFTGFPSVTVKLLNHVSSFSPMHQAIVGLGTSDFTIPSLTNQERSCRQRPNYGRARGLAERLILKGAVIRRKGRMECQGAWRIALPRANHSTAAFQTILRYIVMKRVLFLMRQPGGLSSQGSV